jgi:Fur family zinc uptake transcriptional regulator
MRRQVLNALASSHRPIGAYEIMDIVAADGSRPAPITVYRALDFLIEQGLVHRIESRNAFLGCARRHESGAVVAFLICEKCGAVGEAPAGAIMQTVGAAAKSMGFTAKMSVIEITGLCAHCQSE